MDEVSVSPQPLPPPPAPDIPPQVTPPKRNILPYVVLGLILVTLVGLGAVLWIRKSAQPPATSQLAQVVSHTPAPLPLFLELTSPKSDELAVGEEIIVSGRTLPNITVLIYTDTDQTSLESDANGQFESTVSLDEGSNTLTVTAFADNGDEFSESIDVVYDPQSQ